MTLEQAISIVLEAAEVRATQWREASLMGEDGSLDIVSELFDDMPEAAAKLADEQEEALRIVREHFGGAE